MAGWAEKYKEPRRPPPLFRDAWRRVPGSKKALFMAFFIGFNLLNVGVVFMLITGESYGSANGHSMEHSDNNLIGVFDDYEFYTVHEYDDIEDVVTYFEGIRKEVKMNHDYGHVIEFSRDGDGGSILHRVIVYMRLNLTAYDGDVNTVTMDLPYEGKFNLSFMHYESAFYDGTALTIDAPGIASHALSEGVELADVEGFITRGDNNQAIDQYTMLPVKFGWINGRVEGIDNIFIPSHVSMTIIMATSSATLGLILLVDIVLGMFGKHGIVSFLNKKFMERAATAWTIIIISFGTLSPIAVIYWSKEANTIDTGIAMSALISLALGHLFAFVFMKVMEPKRVPKLRELGFTDMALFYPPIVRTLFAGAVLYGVFFLGKLEFYTLASCVVFPLIGYSLFPLIQRKKYAMFEEVPSEKKMVSFVEETTRGILLLIVFAGFILNLFVPIWLVPSFFIGWLCVDILLIRDHLLGGVPPKRFDTVPLRSRLKMAALSKAPSSNARRLGK